MNDFTTPSINKLFLELEGLGKMPYEVLKRDYKKQKPASSRSLMALHLGVLIAVLSGLYPLVSFLNARDVDK